MVSRLALPAALLLALAACQPKPAGDAPATPAATAPAVAATITGAASYRERIAPPPGAVLTVQLIDNQLADTPTAIIASAEIKDAKGPPFAFELPYDAGKLRPNGSYGLHASLRDADGKLWFVTDTRTSVVPGSGQPANLSMIRVGAEPASAAPLKTQWQCGDQRIAATFDNGAADNVTLDVDGKPLVLPHAVSASGARYADNAGNEFWTKGREGMLTLAGKDKLDCSQTETASPWDAARERGVAFRAVGNEPGWLVEVGAGKAPSLHAELDYGERKLDVASAEATANGFRGRTADGVDVALVATRKACQDDMSGQDFPATAELTVGDKTYRGCGRFLAE
ncbi:YbaY family lipoprotein [Pseudoxanthomonas sp. PXM04]|uniref:YbaY family lipoprotein n=1 Tax=Pseudoxanthomonas sp. PXM04 TaxID=2769297 RepID=UPI00177D05CB|nr:YbaY family lipoprotein [Pseudoxanthomonas sp. PXM04]MBD9376648.1 YbaY family lipoprotein [Pseudoxanthomonas sp. PXM04]